MATRDDEILPNQLDTASCGPGLEIGKDKLVVKYTGRGARGHDVGSIQANKPVPLNRRVYYFEVTVLESADVGKIGVGFSYKKFNVSKLPGADQYSYGYFSDDGKKVHNGQSHRFAESFGRGDVIGAGYHITKQEIFFTKNNKLFGTAFPNVRGQLYPTISLQCKHDCVSVNFGSNASQPFLFDVEAMITAEHEEEQQQITRVPVRTDAMHRLVRQYLLHYGYANTIKAFDEDSCDSSCSTSGDGSNGSSSSSSGSNWLVSSLPVRQKVRQLILSGDVEAAEKMVEQHYPGLLEGAGATQDVVFNMYCQHYIELVRQGHIQEAVTFAQRSLSPMRLSTHHPERDALLRDVIAIVAYQNPQDSPLSYLLSTSQREKVADVVNSAMLSAEAPQELTGPPKSGVELLLQQLSAVHSTLREVNGSQGEVFDLAPHLVFKS